VFNRKKSHPEPDLNPPSSPQYTLHDAVIVGARANSSPNGGTWEPVALYPEAGSMREHGNGVVIGPPGAGKTRMLETNLLNWQHSVVVIDLKGSLYERTAGVRSGLGQVIRLDPRTGTGHS
jgi:hypothetical protein